MQEEIDSMSVAEKLEAMELLWVSLSGTPRDLPSPAWHGEVLAERERTLDSGDTELLSLDEVRRRFRNKPDAS